MNFQVLLTFVEIVHYFLQVMDEEQRQQTSEKTYLSVVPPINNTTREKVAANESTVMIPLPTAATPVAPLLPDHQNVPTPPVTRKKMYSFVPTAGALPASLVRQALPSPSSKKV
jgi:hypothetical protein